MIPAMIILYEGLLYVALLAGLPFFLIAGIARGKYLRNLRERLGFYRGAARPHDLWIHAVSVGEAMAARPVVETIERLRPGTSIVFTTTTITGQAQAARLYPNATVTYFPLDFSAAVRRFLAHHQPRVFATMETEIWPNVTRLSKLAGLRLILANGRISDRSFPRYRMFRSIVGPILRTYDAILAREEIDRERFIAIGASGSSVETTGNVKFDYEPDTASLPVSDEIEALIANRPVVVLGSTIEGEDELLIGSIAKLAAGHGLFFIVAPRKPERFDPVARLLASANLRVVRRSAIQEAVTADVLLLDSLGELSRTYRYATVAFIGGSLVPHGGHNPIEAAAAGVPVCFGPSMSNFREIASLFVEEGAAEQIHGATGFERFVSAMVKDPQERAAWGDRGRRAVFQNRGASGRTAQRIVELLP